MFLTAIHLQLKAMKNLGQRDSALKFLKLHVFIQEFPVFIFKLSTRK